MRERRLRETGANQELNLIFGSGAPPRLLSAMMNELARELLESGDNHVQEARRIRARLPEQPQENALLDQLDRARAAERELLDHRAEDIGEEKILEARALLRKLRIRAGLLRMEAAPSTTSDPIPASSDEAAIFSLIHDTGARALTCRGCGAGFFPADRRNTARCEDCRKGGGGHA